MGALPFRIATTFLLIALTTEAQFQDRLYPIPELTDEMRVEIDLKDGSVEDWLEVLGEPTLTPLEFVTAPWFPDYDPSSFEFRIWLAWHDATDRLFVAAEMVDDIHVITFDRDILFFPEGDATVLFYVDGDKSGGALFHAHAGDETPYNLEQAQIFGAFARTYNDGSNVRLVGVGTTGPWARELPYADGGGAIVDSQPIFSTVEFFVTPFDQMLWDDPELSVISDLFRDKTIGFAMIMADVDTEADADGNFTPESVHTLYGPDASFDQDLIFQSDLWAHGILLGANGRTSDSAVENDTWGRIKASLSE